MSENLAVELENVSFAYTKENVLEKVNLQISQGDFASIVGPNAGGKTTLLMLLLGLLKPCTGKVKVLGKSPKKVRLRIGYMPQHIRLDLHFPITVMEIVLMGRLGKSLGVRYSKKDIKAALSALLQVNLVNFKDSLFIELSGGQMQRVLIARALCCNPDILMLDEPTSNIDAENEEALFEILKQLNKTMTILMVSHDIGFVSQFVKSVICVNRKVVVHPTSQVNGTLIKNIYGGDIRMVRHDHICSEKGHYND